jgi:hypothetical protein
VDPQPSVPLTEVTPLVAPGTETVLRKLELVVRRRLDGLLQGTTQAGRTGLESPVRL